MKGVIESILERGLHVDKRILIMRTLDDIIDADGFDSWDIDIKLTIFRAWRRLSHYDMEEAERLLKSIVNH